MMLGFVGLKLFVVTWTIAFSAVCVCPVWALNKPVPETASPIFAQPSRAQEVESVPSKKMTIHFRSGTSLTGGVREETIAWTTVAANGAVSRFKYPVNAIKSLSLSTAKSTGQLIEIRRLLNQLGDPDYHKRESAEQKLQAIGGQYRSIVESYLDHPSSEVRYRVARLMGMFQSTGSVYRELDQIELVDGRRFEGEAADFLLTLAVYGKTIEVNRQNASGVTSGPKRLQSPRAADRVVQDDEAGQPVRIELFHQFESFVSKDQKEFGFDVQRDGSPMPFKTNLNDVYVSDGLMLRSQGRGYVGASPFSFRYEKLPVGGRSAGLLGQQRGRDFKGVVVVEFCVPGEKNVTAGVHEFGTFIAKVNAPRDIIMEAYNAAGQLLATVEATDQKCVFAGIKSNHLITQVRILSNPYLQKIERVIDDDFAIDSLRMSAPIATVVDVAQSIGQTVLKNGDRIKWSNLNITRDSAVRLSVDDISDGSIELSFPMEDVGSLFFGRSMKSTNAWQAMLDDGSQINVLPGKSFRSKEFNLKMAPDQIVGCWPALSPPRMPVGGDLELGDGAALVVFPTCRIKTKSLRFLNDRITWRVEQKLQQPLQSGGVAKDEDPTPQSNAFRYADTLASQLPTVWNRPPTLTEQGHGFVLLTDGQRLAIGKGCRFRLKGIGTRTVTMAAEGGTPMDIPLAEIQAIQFPVP